MTSNDTVALSALVAYGPESPDVSEAVASLLEETAATEGTELVLVDDATTAAVRATLERLTGRVRLLHHRSVVGRQRSLRYGSEVADGEVLLLLSSATKVHAGLFAELQASFGADPGLGVVTLESDPEAMHFLAIRRGALESIGGIDRIDPASLKTPMTTLVPFEVFLELRRSGWRGMATRGAMSLAAPTNWRGEGAAAIPSIIRHAWRPPYTTEEKASGINVVGLFEAACGIGDSIRRYTEAIDLAGLPHSTHAYNFHSSPAFPYEHHDGDYLRYDTNLVALNPDVLAFFGNSAGTEFWSGRYMIGLWYWEVEELSATIKNSFRLVNELWAPTRFLRDALAAGTDRPVLTIPHPVRERDGRPVHTRAELSLPEGFVFLTTFDFASLALRKNSIGVVRAFCAAFAPGEGPVLVLKTLNAGHDPIGWAALQHEMGGRRDILVLDGYLGDEEISELVGSADCYVSLHRSEGFGLTPAEAMAWGRPVIATGYSGNLEFMNEDNSYLVPYDLVQVDRRVARIYPPNAKWAEPRLEDAAAMFRRVYEQQDEARAVGARARNDIRRTNSYAAAAAAIGSRFAELAAMRAGAAARRASGERSLITNGAAR